MKKLFSIFVFLCFSIGGLFAEELSTNNVVSKPKVDTVANVLKSAKNQEKVILEGTLKKQVKMYIYTFEDASGSIDVDFKTICKKAYKDESKFCQNGYPVVTNTKSKIRIEAEVDRSGSNTPELEVIKFRYLEEVKAEHHS
jgi:uncharacterized protein YdeI (BOF family)